MLNNLWRDVVFAIRTLRKRPGFTLTAIITLGLGIGVNAAVFSIVNALMLRPLPVPDADRLVSIVSRGSEQQFMQSISFPEYLDYRGMSDVFSDAIAFNPAKVQLTADRVPESIITTLCTGNYFTTLGLNAALGRVFSSEEGDIGGEPVAVLSHGFWQQRFAGDPAVIGKSVTVNRQAATIIGVTPAKFPGTVGYLKTDAFIPFSTWALIEPDLREQLDDRTGYWRVVARIRNDVSFNEAQAAVTTMSANLERDHPDTNRQERAFIFPEPLTRTEAAAASFMPPVAMVFMAMVSLVLLIACANVANLLLARAAERKREIAVRSALGAGRLQIARQMLVESLMISLAGGLAGLVLAHWAGKALSSVRVASDYPFHFDASVDLRVFGFAALAAVIAGVIAGLAPAIHAVRANLAETLKEGGRSVTAGGRKLRLRDLLVTSQVAVSLVLLVCTALFVRSMINVSRLDLGFDAENRLIMSVDAELLGYEEEQGRIFFRDLLERVRSMPGVVSAANSRFLPVGFETGSTLVFLEGESVGAADDNEIPRAVNDMVGPGYFETMGIAILGGRAFNEQDDETSRPVAIVNRTMADELWPGQDPLGKRFSVVGPGGPFLEVVGVARTCAHSIPGESPQQAFYQPMKQRHQGKQIVIVHAVSNPTGLVPAIRSEIQALDPDMPISDVRTLESHVSEGKAEILFKLPARMVGIFALIGAALAALGLYAVISYSVGQRTHEIGVRVAMGATPSSIVKLVLSKGLVLGGAGVAIGILLAWIITGRFAFLFVGISAGDPPTYIMASIAVLLVALTASYIPARFRAARIEPSIALREE